MASLACGGLILAAEGFPGSHLLLSGVAIMEGQKYMAPFSVRPSELLDCKPRQIFLSVHTTTAPRPHTHPPDHNDFQNDGHFVGGL